MSTKSTYASAAAGALRGRLAARDSERRSKQKGLSRVAVPAPARRNDLLPKLRLIDRDPHALIAPARNVRGLEAGHVREVANSILQLGFTAPALIDEGDHLIDGVVRVEAAKLLKLSSMPCVVVDGLTPPELRLLRLAINRLGEKNVWGLDQLKLEFEELIIEEAPLDVTGFELTEIDGILTEVEPAVVEPGPIAVAAGQRPVSRPGDVFILGDHRVICGDARDASVLDRLMGEDRARFVLTDQPYNVPITGHVTGGAHREFVMASGEMTEAEFRGFNEEWIREAVRYLIEGGLLATFIDWRGLGSVSLAAMAAMLRQINLIVWAKTNAGMGSLYRSQHELLPLFKKGDVPHVNNVDLGRKGRWRSNVWPYAGASSVGSEARQGLQDHPTVKPVAMLAEALLDLTDRGEIVLDPFLGSGSTLIAAEQTGRVCRGVEIDPLYVDLIVRRYEKVTSTVAVLEETGETFAALAQRRSEPGQAPALADNPVRPSSERTNPLPMALANCRKRTRASLPAP